MANQSPGADRNLLAGILALQHAFITRDQLVDAMNRWVSAKEVPLERLLPLSAEDGALLAGMLRRHLALRGMRSRFVAVCNTVAHADAKGVLHRDLKPANVLLGDYGETIVVDWGMAKVMDEPQEAKTQGTGWLRLTTNAGPDATQQGDLFGTLEYAAPEQARGEHDTLSFPGDGFALGATLYALLTGKAPYGGAGLLAQAQRGAVVPARQHKPAVPRALEAVCLKAMATQPQDR